MSIIPPAADGRNRFVPWIQGDRGLQAAEAIASQLIGEPKAADERYFHKDIGGRSDAELRYEREQLRYGLTFTCRPQPWATERLSLIDRELEVRRGN